MDDKYLSITALTRYIKYKIDSDENLKTVYLKGEISNFKAHSSGHLYFSLKDETSLIKAIMFKNSALKLDFNPKEGTKVLVKGSISVYEAGGTYQIYVTEMQEDGIGNLYILFEKLKKQLMQEGLFDPKYKKTIPAYPKKVGIITASTGAAIRDILSTIKRRYPICETYLFSCLVQGENAPKDIVKQLKLADSYGMDILIVGRGGGSFEDMNCFNDEEVARTIFACTTPIISAVGHEIDYTIADFVADLRAPTPTGAAEMAVPNMVDLINMVSQYKIRLNEAILKKANYLKLVMEHIKKNRILTNPIILLENSKNNLENKIDKLELLNPLSVLKRGYSITYKEEKAIKTIKNIRLNDNIKIHLTDGILNATVTEVQPNGK